MKLLEEILTQPTAPFREIHVIRLLRRVLTEAHVPHFQDPIGNIIVGASSRADYLRLLNPVSVADKKEPLRVFIAHLDHPGFHGVKWESPTRLSVKWHGGTPTQRLVGARVWIADAQSFRTEGRVVESKLTQSGRSIDTATIEVSLTDMGPSPKASNLFGGFKFRAPFWRGEGENSKLIYTHVADDLVGAFAITRLAIEHFASAPKGRKKGLRKGTKQPRFIGLLTRAEEVGFIGAIGHFELGWLKKAKRPVLGVSLETSRTLPGAEIGKGPVVRLGDRMTVFDSGAIKVFSSLAAKVLPDQHQRRIMDGGACEATAATAYGIPCIGISVPLGNYHNQSLEGGPDAAENLGPAPEFVHESDVEGLLTLCRELVQPGLAWDKPWKSTQDGFKKSLKSHKNLLKTGAWE